MKVFRYKGRHMLCCSAKEIVALLLSDFFNKLLSATELKNEAYDSENVSSYIKKLSNQTADSSIYELYTAVLELYQMFEKQCEFCFYMNSKYDPNVSRVASIKELYTFREDPPDIIILNKSNLLEFELKRYRDEFNFDKVLAFIMKKIYRHYSVESNYLIILQLKPYSNIDLNIFTQLNKKLKLEKTHPGVIGFTLNRNNEEMYTIQIIPELNISTRPYNEIDEFTKILNSDN